MIYMVLADLTVLVHFLWVAFIILGAIWGRTSRAVRIVHLSGLGLAVILNVMQWYCPLTHLETWLRQRHSQQEPYPGSFIAHYLEKLIYVEIPMRAMIAPTLILLAITLWIYFGRGGCRQAHGEGPPRISPE